MPTVRVREAVVVEHPDVDVPVVLHPGAAYPSDDPLVRAYPWAFETDNVEQATAAPGEKRQARR